MKKLILVLFSALSVSMISQEYQYSGTINGRPATLLLHFVTASDNPSEIWSHGSFYFEEDEIPNVIYQFKPKYPEAGVLKFNLIPINIKRLDYVEGEVSKSAFKGKYVLEGKDFPIHFPTKENQKFTIYNYYKNEPNSSGNSLQYFGKFIAPSEEKIMFQLIEYLEVNAKKIMPRTYLEEYYKTQWDDFSKNGNEDWLVNLAIYPIIATQDKVVYKVNYYTKHGENTVKDYTTFINYEVKSRKIVDSKNLFQSGKENEIEAVIQKNAQKSTSNILQTNYQKVPYTSNIYLVKDGVMFFYPAILDKDSKPFGPFEVYVPFEDLNGLMN